MTKPNSFAVVTTLLASIALLSPAATSFVPSNPSAASVSSANSDYNDLRERMMTTMKKTTTTSMFKISRQRRRLPHSPHFSSSQPETTAVANTSSPVNSSIFEATLVLQSYDQSQQSFQQQQSSQNLSPGLAALQHIQSISPSARTSLQCAIRTLVDQAHVERAEDSSRGRIMLGICASNAPEALAGLKSWVSSLSLPRGMLHGMDVDGVPIPVEDLGAVYVKYSTGGAMTFSEMRRSGRGFDALWRPGDALLEGGYDGDFRGVYLNVELGDGVFRQFGVLPTDLFMEEEDW